jgi:diketogulonate reductase-like aldo/keto reductase
MTTIPNVTLHNGVKMPIIGFGVFQMNDDEAEQRVYDALMAGYRLIDRGSSHRETITSVCDGCTFKRLLFHR